MPPPSLSMTTIRTGVSVSRGRRQAADVVQQAEVAGDDRGRPAAGVGGADPRGDEAVDPVGAAVAEEERVGLAAGQERLLVADRHARRRVDEVAVAVGAAERQVQRRLADRRADPTRGEGVDQRLAGGALGLQPGRRLAARFALQPCRPAGGQLGRVGAEDRRRPVGRLVPAAAVVDDDLVAAARRQPGAQRLAGRQLAEAEDQLGRRPSGRSARRAAAGRRSRRPASGRAGRSAAARSARRGSGSRRRGRGGRAARAARGRAGGRRRSRPRSRRRCGRRPPRSGRRSARGRGWSPRSAAGCRVPPAPAGHSPSPPPRPQSAPAARARAG